MFPQLTVSLLFLLLQYYPKLHRMKHEQYVLRSYVYGKVLSSGQWHHFPISLDGFRGNAYNLLHVEQNHSQLLFHISRNVQATEYDKEQ